MTKSSSKLSRKNFDNVPVWLQLMFVAVITVVPVALLFGLVLAVTSFVNSDSFTDYAMVAFLFSLLFIIPAAIYAFLSDKDPFWKGDVWVKARTAISLAFLIIGVTAHSMLFLSDPASQVNELAVLADRLNLSTGEILFVRDAFAPSIIVAIVGLITASILSSKRARRSSRRAWVVVGVSLAAFIVSVFVFGRSYL